ncbi:MAG: CoA transferase [Alphaproteobacteria bacterium]|nr:CoA transferase [Alphaproteobacteria bacterium]
MDDAKQGGALSGITVLALEQAVAAPYCTSRLADAGARVIKVERAEGDFARGYDRAAKGMSSYFAWLNRGKESLAADIKAPADAALLHRILAHADVLVQNLLPGAAARAGFGSDELRARHPRLVAVDISGYGDEGPYAAMKSYDMLVQAETGLASITGGPEAPARVGVSVCDIAAGMYAHQAVLEALIRRGRTGEGASIKVSLFDGMADWMAVPLLFSDYGPGAPRRVGLSHPSVAPYDPFPSADGTPVLVSIQNDREWQRFCAEVLEQPGLASDPAFATNVQRVANRARMDAIIREAFARHGTEALCARLLAAGIAFARVNSVAEFSRHPQLRRVRVQTPAGEVALPAPPPVVDGRREPALGPVPALDAHGEAIRREFGA